MMERHELMIVRHAERSGLTGVTAPPRAQAELGAQPEAGFAVREETDHIGAYLEYAVAHPELSRRELEGAALLLLLMELSLRRGGTCLELASDPLASLLGVWEAKLPQLSGQAAAAGRAALRWARQLLEHGDAAAYLRASSGFFAWDNPRGTAVADRTCLYPRSSFIITLARPCPFIERIAIAEAELVAGCAGGSDGAYPPLARLQQLCLLVLLLDHRMQRGDVCLRLEPAALEQTLELVAAAARSRSDCAPETAGRFLAAAAALLHGLDAAALMEDNRDFLAARRPGAVLAADPRLCRLYLRRYHDCECHIARCFNEAAGEPPGDPDPRLTGFIAALFGPLTAADDDDENQVDWQRVAACLALTRRRAVICGGPGTGKTTAVLYILLLLCAQSAAPLRMALAAPTGKAAARITQAISALLEQEDFELRARALAVRAGRSYDELCAGLPRTAQTLHALLGLVPHHGRRAAARPLGLDVLVVDEASMVDMAMFSRLLEALPAQARLIVLGDRDQLCSVEAGSVLGDLCASLSGTEPACSAELLDRLSLLSGYPAALLRQGSLSDWAVLLSHSRRFGADSAIARLARTTNDPHLKPGQRREDFERCCADPRCRGSVEWRRLAGDAVPGEEARAALENLLETALDEARADTYGAFLQRLCAMECTVSTDEDADALTQLMDRYRILCSNHGGFLGDHRLNAALEQRVRERTAGDGEFYPGRIVLITRNDALRGIYNGDVGFVARDGRDGGRLKVFIRSGTGFARIAPIFLAHCEPGFALTVHKSQGSEYEHVAIVLAPEYNRALSRELVYTALTRARERITLYASPAVLEEAMAHRVHRESALAERLAAPAATGGVTRPADGYGMMETASPPPSAQAAPAAQQGRPMLEEGSPAPDFTLPDQDGQPVALHDFAGRRVAIYFYPRDNTPGCTRQACAFAALHAALSEAGITVLGISRDSVTSHQKFAARHELPFRLLSDESHEVLQTYGAWGEKKQYGKVTMGTIRSTFLIDEQGRIAKVFRKAKPDTNAQEVLDYFTHG